MPWFFTSSGSLGMARSRLFCTCIMATSGSVPVSKVMRKKALPSDEEEVDM